MTQEDKELLLKDLSARLPYGVKCCVKNNHKVCGILNGIVGENIHLYSSGCSTYNISVIKPYLFPLSSITEEQRFELKKQHSKDGKILQEICKEIYTNMNLDKSGLGVTYNAEDWCNANHFDYRGLIEKGLANDATGLNIYD